MTDTTGLDERATRSDDDRPGPANREDKRPTVKPTAVVAAGLAAAVAALFTSRFGIAGTILGTAATAMIITAGSATIGFLLERAAGRARDVPSALRTRRTPGRPVLVGALVAVMASFLIGMATVTGVELSAGKSLSCWVWDACPSKTAGTEAASDGRTLPSILGGGQRNVGTSAQPGGVEQHQPAVPQRQRALELPQGPHKQPVLRLESDNPKPLDTPDQDTLAPSTPGEEVPRQAPQPSPSGDTASPDRQSETSDDSGWQTPSERSPSEEPTSGEKPSEGPAKPSPDADQRRPTQ